MDLFQMERSEDKLIDKLDKGLGYTEKERVRFFFVG
jgi:hypothetical protein